jgi:fatty-acyl-CoA synthase
MALSEDADGTSRRPANFVPLSPVSFLARAERVHPAKTAVIEGERRFTYAQMGERCRRLASALERLGVRPGETVSVFSPNTPMLLEAHFGVPMTRAVLNAINVRLDPPTVAFILRHGRARVFLVDPELAPVATAALALLEEKPVLVVGGGGEADDGYERLLSSGDPLHPVHLPADEWDSISLNYTSGTTGNPKGALYHHRGAYLNSCANCLVFGLDSSTVYLWTLPMFHCNGWSHAWAVTLAGGTHVCLRKVEPRAVLGLVARHRVTHLAGAPVVLNMLSQLPAEEQVRLGHPVKVAVGGAAPPSAVIARMERMGFRVTHLYGLTESFGPATVCVLPPDVVAAPLEQRAAFTVRQGVRHPMLEESTVLDPETLEPVPADGQTLGELMLRGNTLMKGYLANPAASAAAFAGNWFHTGDLAVLHPDGYVEIKDRAKDIIISGGENISSLEVEEVLYRHPDVLEAAVVARPDETWGETPHAFVTLKPGAEGRLDAPALITWCRGQMAHFKCPRHVTFGPLPKTATGKIQKYLLRQRASGTVADGPTSEE